MPTTQSTSQQARRAGDQVASEAKNFVTEAKDMLQEKIGSENLDAVFGLLQSVGNVCMRGFKQTATYARRHPVRIAFGVVALGVIGSMLAKSSKRETLH